MFRLRAISIYHIVVNIYICVCVCNFVHFYSLQKWLYSLFLADTHTHSIATAMAIDQFCLCSCIALDFHGLREELLSAIVCIHREVI